MKSKILIIIAFIVLVCLPLKAEAAETNFGAGSLIIPMDSFYQPEADGGLLEAYGLIFYLLNHKDSDGQHDISVHWIVNPDKTTIGSVDFEIEDNTVQNPNAVVKVYDHAGGTSTLTYNTGDTFQKVTYAGAPFIIDAAEAAAAKTVINDLNWAAVEVHEAQVPFKAPVYREMRGTPPRIALMNNTEVSGSGNAQILEAYLRLAGICSDIYDVVTPCEVRDGILTTGGYDFMWAPHWTGDKRYPNDDDECTADGDAVTEVVEIVKKTREFLEAGKGLLAECSAITTFEGTEYGYFLTDKGFGHDGGRNLPEYIIYNDATAPNAQTGDYDYDPEGGSLHNWRPYQDGDPYDLATLPDVSGGNSIYNSTVSRFISDDWGWDYYVGGYLDGDTSNGYVAYLGGHKYASCKGTGGETDPDPEVHLMDIEFTKEIRTDSDKEHFTLKVEYNSGSETRITFDAADIADFSTLTVSTFNLDDPRYRWTASAASGKYYLEKAGGGDPLISEPSDVLVDGAYMVREFGPITSIAAGGWGWGRRDADSLAFDTVYVELSGSVDPDTKVMQAEFPLKTGGPLELDLSTASLDKKKKKIKDVTFRNTGSSAITVDSLTFYWDGGVIDQTFKKITDLDTDLKVYDKPEIASGVTPAAADFTTFSIDAAGGAAVDEAAGCTDNSDCSWTNIAGVRYILNTLFNIKFQISNQEYARAAPIVSYPYLYQGSFDYPSYEGHFRGYTVTDTSASADTADWDTADGHITDANTGNSDGRKVYTSKYVSGAWTRIDFDAANISDLRAPLDVTPANGDDSDEIAVIERVRGKIWNSTTNSWDERSNKLGAVMHSAPVVVESNSRTNSSRDETAYVGDLYGMLHAIETEATGGETGDEKWAYIPSNMLNKLQNDRTDENAPQSFAAVDGSPTAADIYYDHDNDNDASTAKQWRTVLVSPQGSGGNYIFALDITEPDLTINPNWSVLWEITVEAILNYSGTGGFSVDDTVTGVTSGATGVVTEDDEDNDDLTLKDVVGAFEEGETVFADANSSGTLDGGELNVTVANVIEMGSAFRASLDKVKWPVYDQGVITNYESKAVVFVATGFARIAQSQGGINVFAFELKTGNRLWYFSSRYSDSVNDIPGAITPFDTTGDGFVDQIFVGDMNGRMWQLDAVDGSNPYGFDNVAGKEIPLWNAGVGNPISVSPAIVKVNPVVVIFGTGGTDWADNNSQYKVYAINATDMNPSPTHASGGGTLYWDPPVELAVGEKVWSTPTIAGDQIFLSTSTGTMESTDPKGDVTTGAGKIYARSLTDGSETWSLTTGKARGSVYVDRGHVYLTTIDSDVIQIGDGDFSENDANSVILKSWRQLD